MGQKLWCRDSIVWSTDIGSTDGTLVFDLLTKVHSGTSWQENVQPAVRQALLDKYFPGAKELPDVQGDMRAPVTVGLPPVNIVGARILRTIMTTGFIFATPLPAVPPNFEATAAAGWFEGLVISPRSSKWFIAPPTTGVLGHPGDEEQAMTIDWLWWSRKYAGDNGLRRLTTTEANICYSTIDTRNGRRFDTQGESLYYHMSPNGPTMSLPAQGTTINGGVANWSVLLELPG